MKRIVSAALSLLAFAPVAACGDDGGPSTTQAADAATSTDAAGGASGDATGGGADVEAPAAGFNSAFPEATEMSSMTDAERTTLCGELQAHVETVIDLSEMNRAGCTLSAIFSVSMGAAQGKTCEELVTTCLAESGEDGGGDPCEGMIDATCEATVGEVQACADARLMQIKPLLAITCASTMDEVEAISGGAEQLPEACAPMQAKCPELFESEEGGDPQAGEGGGGTPTPR